MNLGETHKAKKIYGMAGRWFQKAAEISRRFVDSANPDLLNSISRAQLRYSTWLIEEGKSMDAKEHIELALETLAVELRIRHDPILCRIDLQEKRREEKKREEIDAGNYNPDKEERPIKNVPRTEVAYKLFAIALAQLGFCYEARKDFDKTLECHQFAQLVIKTVERRLASQENSRKMQLMERNFNRLLVETQGKYKQLLEERNELIRVMTYCYESYNLHALPGETYEEEDLRNFQHECKQRMWDKMEQDGALSNMRLGIKAPLDEESVSEIGRIYQQKEDEKREERAKSLGAKKTETSLKVQERGMSGNIRPGEKSERRIKKNVIEIADESESKKHPMKEYFEKDVFEDFKVHLLYKNKAKEGLDMKKLHEDRFWLIRDKKVNRYSTTEQTTTSESTTAQTSSKPRLGSPGRSKLTFSPRKLELSTQLSNLPTIERKPDPLLTSVFSAAVTAPFPPLANTVQLKSPEEREESPSRPRSKPSVHPQTKEMDSFFRRRIASAEERERREEKVARTAQRTLRLHRKQTLHQGHRAVHSEEIIREETESADEGSEGAEGKPPRPKMQFNNKLSFEKYSLSNIV